MAKSVEICASIKSVSKHHTNLVCSWMQLRTHLRLRNTPTGVGKTTSLQLRQPTLRKHPHGRGEDAVLALLIAVTRETPPRTWGRPHGKLPGVLASGNTPTGVGKTDVAFLAAIRCEKHPHGRGEDATILSIRGFASETPPRAWGRHYVSQPLARNNETPPRAWGRLVSDRDVTPHRGNTPTGVGKTTRPLASRLRLRKHPHGRGEDSRHRRAL